MEKKPCIYGLYTYCVVYSNLAKNRKEWNTEWGTEKWIKIHCILCIKTVYAKAKMKIRYKVVL